MYVKNLCAGTLRERLTAYKMDMFVYSNFLLKAEWENFKHRSYSLFLDNNIQTRTHLWKYDCYAINILPLICKINSLLKHHMEK